jgi:enamine deaminase RidA (YjgF/YER057c/UK114 family)
VPEDAGAQADICLANIDAILRAAGAGREDVVRINAFVTDRGAHARLHGGARPLAGGVARLPPRRS